LLLLLLFFFFFVLDLVQVGLQTRSFAARFLKLLLRLPILFNSGSGFVERSFHGEEFFRSFSGRAMQECHAATCGFDG
jgi:hypothetical protein